MTAQHHSSTGTSIHWQEMGQLQLGFHLNVSKKIPARIRYAYGRLLFAGVIWDGRVVCTGEAEAEAIRSLCYQ